MTRRESIGAPPEPGGHTATSTQAPSIVAAVRDLDHQLGRRLRGVQRRAPREAVRLHPPQAAPVRAEPRVPQGRAQTRAADTRRRCGRRERRAQGAVVARPASRVAGR